MEEAGTPKPHNWRRMWPSNVWLRLALVALLACLIGGLAVWLTVLRGPAIPVSIQRSANFPLYYPKLPKDYRVDRNSLRYTSSNTLFMTITGPGDVAIMVNEQAMPAGLNIEQIPQKSDDIAVNDGRAVLIRQTPTGSQYVGISVPSGNHTLIMVNSDDATRKDVINTLQAMRRFK